MLIIETALGLAGLIGSTLAVAAALATMASEAQADHDHARRHERGGFHRILRR